MVDAKSFAESPAAGVRVQAKVASTPQPSTVSTSVTSSKPVASVSAPVCVPDTVYQLPSKLALAQLGVQQVVDAPSDYVVYGNTPSQVMSQIARCTPVRSSSGKTGAYAASTAYAINWQFDYSGSSQGLCTLSNVKVGLDINQVFPGWQGSGAMAADWQSYIGKLHAYENGHVQLDETSASTILSDLQHFPPTNCASIGRAANDKADADVQTYDVANANYDTESDYGLKQGLVL